MNGTVHPLLEPLVPDRNRGAAPPPVTRGDRSARLFLGCTSPRDYSWQSKPNDAKRNDAACYLLSDIVRAFHEA
eukprot:6938986-Pyramimonas_sp.AAC.2